MYRFLSAALVLALPQLAWAQTRDYCDRSVMAIQWETTVTPGGTGNRASYRVQLQNNRGADLRIRVSIQGSFQDRPTGEITLRRGTPLWLNLGTQTVLPGAQALRGDALAAVLRITCL